MMRPLTVIESKDGGGVRAGRRRHEGIHLQGLDGVALLHQQPQPTGNVLAAPCTMKDPDVDGGYR